MTWPAHGPRSRRAAGRPTGLLALLLVLLAMAAACADQSDQSRAPAAGSHRADHRAADHGVAGSHHGAEQVAATPFHLRYDDNGLVIRVQEQYLP